MERKLTAAASSLLDELRRIDDGRDVVIPSIYPGASAFSDRARAYLFTANEICTRAHANDRLVFAVLYNIRHGLELWLKAVAVRTALNDLMGELRGTTKDFKSIAQALEKRASRSGAKARREVLMNALCVVRNTAVDGLKYPACQTENIGESWANQAVQHLRSSTDESDMFRVSISWTAPNSTHDLGALWDDVRWAIEWTFSEARCVLGELDGSPMPIDRIAAACDLFHALDPLGDTFRYPASLDGQWNILGRGNLSLSFRRLGALASELEDAVAYYESAVEHGIC